MTSMSRRAFVAAAAMAASIPTCAHAEGVVGFLQKLERAAQIDADQDDPTHTPDVAVPSPTIPDYSAYDSDEIVSIILDALKNRDFETILALCAVEDYLDSLIPALGTLRAFAPEAGAGLPPEWDLSTLRLTGVARMLAAARLRGLYAADLLRCIADVAAGDVGRRMTYDEVDGKTVIKLGPEPVNRQLVEIDEALGALDDAGYQVLSISRSSSIADVVRDGWLDHIYAEFESGREAALEYDPTWNLDTVVYRCEVGRSGATELAFALPLCRYRQTWRLQRPIAFAKTATEYVWPAGDGAPFRAPFVGVAVEPQEVDYVPAPPIDATPYASPDDAIDELLRTLCLTGDAAGVPDARMPVRLTCADAFFQTADLGRFYDGTDTSPIMGMLDYVNLGSTAPFFVSSAEFLPVAAAGYRTLACHCLANKHVAAPLLLMAQTCSRVHAHERAALDEATARALTLFQPVQSYMDAEQIREYFSDAIAGTTEHTALFEALTVYIDCLNRFWTEFGHPALTYVACDDMTAAMLESAAFYVGPGAQSHHVLCEDGDVWQALRCFVAPCGDGWRIADVELLSKISHLLPVVDQPDGIAALEGMTPAEVRASLMEELSEAETPVDRIRVLDR